MISSITTQMHCGDSYSSWQLRMYRWRTVRRISSSVAIDSSSLMSSFRLITLIATFFFDFVCTASYTDADEPWPRILP